jgi:hypothetical protein
MAADVWVWTCPPPRSALSDGPARRGAHERDRGGDKQCSEGHTAGEPPASNRPRDAGNGGVLFTGRRRDGGCCGLGAGEERQDPETDVRGLAAIFAHVGRCVVPQLGGALEPMFDGARVEASPLLDLGAGIPLGVQE